MMVGDLWSQTKSHHIDVKMTLLDETQPSIARLLIVQVKLPEYSEKDIGVRQGLDIHRFPRNIPTTLCTESVLRNLEHGESDVSTGSVSLMVSPNLSSPACVTRDGAIDD